MIMHGNSQQAPGHCSYSGKAVGEGWSSVVSTVAKQRDDLILQAMNRGTPPPDSRQFAVVAFADSSGSEQKSNLKKPEIESVSLLVNVKVA